MDNDNLESTDISMAPRMCPKCGILLVHKHDRRERWICINPDCAYYEESHQDNLMG